MQAFGCAFPHVPFEHWARNVCGDQRKTTDPLSRSGQELRQAAQWQRSYRLLNRNC